MLDQIVLPLETAKLKEPSIKDVKRLTNGQANKLAPGDRAFHDWYRFVLSFPPHLVREYLADFGLTGDKIVLDPFCGTGTTLVEAKRRGVCARGLEANPFAHFVSSVKLDWSIEPEIFLKRAYEIAEAARTRLRRQGIEDDWPQEKDFENSRLRKLDDEAAKLLLANSISPLPLHKTLVLLDCLKAHEQQPYYRHARLALANALVFTISNLHFGPEVGVGKAKHDVPVISSWLVEVEKMARDLFSVAHSNPHDSQVFLADARQICEVLPPQSIDGVITSPPYPNEKDYTRTTRLESVLLGFIHNKAELRELKQKLVRSNTRGVYAIDDDHKWVADHPEIQRIAQEIERRRLELGKTSGFEKQYGRVTRLYFGGMARHFAQLRDVLRPGARLAYVVGDQASYLRVMIRTGQLLADIAQALGYELVRIDLFRERFSTATKEHLREEVVVLHWPGHRR